MKRIVLSAIWMSFAWASLMPASAQYRPDRPDFYDEGRRQLNREIERLNDKKPDHLLSIDETAFQWQEFTLSDGKFKIQFPGVPETRSESLSSQADSLEFQGLVLNLMTVSFVAGTLNYPISNVPVDPETVLADVQAQLLEDLQAQAVEERSITLETYPGKELKVNQADETLIFRIYWVDQRLYLLGTRHQSQTNEPEAISQFLNSFQMIQSMK